MLIQKDDLISQSTSNVTKNRSQAIVSTVAQREGKFCHLSGLLGLTWGLLDKFRLSHLQCRLKTSFSLREVTLHKALRVELRTPVP